jgi:hypothetical protein
MNRRERRARWLAHHRGEFAERGNASAHNTQRRDAADDRSPRSAPGPPAEARFESHALRVERPAVGSLRLHIEEMVLYGFNLGDRYAVGDSVQQELTRLVGVDGAHFSLDAPRPAERINAGSFRATPNSRPGVLGAQVARAVYGGLRQ